MAVETIHRYGGPEPSDTSPYKPIGRVSCYSRADAYQGILMDQLRNTAASPSNVRSVTTALPSLKNNPPIAGNNAKPRGIECQCDDSLCVPKPEVSTLGRNKSSVEERKDCFASSRESEKLELRRGLWRSAKVEARPRGRWRRGDMLRLADECAIEFLDPLMPSGGGLLSLLAMI